MCNEQIRHALLGLNFPKQIKNLSLHRNIQRGGRLVTNHDLRFNGQRSGNGNALTLSAGKFMRQAIGCRRRQSHTVEKLAHFPTCICLGEPRTQRHDSFAHQFPHAHARIKRRKRILKHDLRATSQMPFKASACVKGHLSGYLHAAAHRSVFQKSQGGLAQRRFAGPGLSNQSQGLSPGQRQRCVTDRLKGLLSRKETTAAAVRHRYVRELQYRFFGTHRLLQVRCTACYRRIRIEASNQTTGNRRPHCRTLLQARLFGSRTARCKTAT